MSSFTTACRDCPRLAEFLDATKAQYPDYHCKAVAPFGDPAAQLLIVGLAPGMHGANRTGRPFTGDYAFAIVQDPGALGDYAGVLLYETLHRHGFATRPESLSADDGLELVNARITNAVKCLPPENKPVGAEINTCNRYLGEELEELAEGSIVLALGGIAHRAVIKARGGRQADYKFAHGALHRLGDLQLLDSYHCSRYNTNTGRLTEAMFNEVFEQAAGLLEAL